MCEQQIEQPILALKESQANFLNLHACAVMCDEAVRWSLMTLETIIPCATSALQSTSQLIADLQSSLQTEESNEKKF